MQQEQLNLQHQQQFGVNNTNTSAGDVTVRNADDDADVGTISIPPNTGIVIHLEPGQGLRGASTMNLELRSPLTQVPEDNSHSKVIK